MKKILSAILIITLLFGVISGLSGCSKKEGDELLTRAAWIDVLAQQYNLDESISDESVFNDVSLSNPYFSQIQACVEWDIIEKSAEFKPNDNATNGFAIATVVKAIGIARLEKSDYKASLDTEEKIFDFFKTQSGLNMSIDKTLTKSKAEEIIAKAHSISDDMILPQSYREDLNENVRKMTVNQISFGADGKTATLTGGVANVGDIILIESNEYLPEGKLAKVTAKDGNKITYTTADPKDAINDVSITGTYMPKIIAARPLMDGITIENSGGEMFKPLSTENNAASPESMLYNPSVGKPKIEPMDFRSSNYVGDYVLIKFGEKSDSNTIENNQGQKGKAGLSASISGSVKLKNTRVTLDIPTIRPLFWSDKEVPNPLAKHYIRVDADFEIDVSLSAKLATKIPVAVIPIPICGVVDVMVTLWVEIGIDGTISLTYSVPTTTTIELAPLKMPKIDSYSDTENSSLELKLKIKGYVHIKPEIALTLVGGTIKVAKISATTGVEASASTSLDVVNPNLESVCLDLAAYVPLKLSVWAGIDVGGFDFGAGWDFVIFDANFSPLTWTGHLEEDGLVPECTKGTKPSTPEFDEIDTEPLLLESTLWISSFYVSLDAGQNDTLGITEIPEGYSQNRIKYESSDPSKVTVDSNGKISAVSSGSAVIKVSTEDDKFAQYCVVTVRSSSGVQLAPIL